MPVRLSSAEVSLVTNRVMEDGAGGIQEMEAGPEVPVSVEVI